MSSNVRSYGFIAVLLTPVPAEVREDINEKLYELKSNLRVGNDGTLIYADYNLKKPLREKEQWFGLHIGVAKSMAVADFCGELAETGQVIDTRYAIQPYNCIWYNAVDSDMALLTKEAFLAHAEQKA